MSQINRNDKCRYISSGVLGGSWVGTPWCAPPPQGQAARMHMHPVVLDNITNNQILKLFVEKNSRILDLLKLFIIFVQSLFSLVYTFLKKTS